MEAGADTQQSGETVVSESEAQHITLTQVNINQHFERPPWKSEQYLQRLDESVLSWLQASIAASQLTTGGSTVTLVQLPNGQTVQVHGVIQAAQPSVIQSPQVQTVQVRTQLRVLCRSQLTHFSLINNKSRRTWNRIFHWFELTYHMGLEATTSFHTSSGLARTKHVASHFKIRV